MLWLKSVFLCGVILVFLPIQTHAQLDDWEQQENRTAVDTEDRTAPNKPLDVITLRHPSFGSFHCGSGGGSITIEGDGTRTSEGDIILMSSGVATSPAIFEVRCEPYTMLQLFQEGEFVLRGSNGDDLRVTVLSTSPSFPCVAPANSAQGFTVTASVRLNLEPGQTLSSGSYVGMFQTTWVTE